MSYLINAILVIYEGFLSCCVLFRTYNKGIKGIPDVAALSEKRKSGQGPYVVVFCC